MTTIREALNSILNNDRDYAREENGVGFNKPDTSYAHLISSYPKWNDYHQNKVHQMLKKYYRQYDTKWENLEFEETFDLPNSDFIPEQAETYTNKKPKKENKLHLTKGSTGRVTGFSIESQYSFKDIAKSIPGKAWDSKNVRWLYPLREDTIKSLYELITNKDIYEHHILIVDPDAKDYIIKNKDLIKNTAGNAQKEAVVKSNRLELNTVDGELLFQWFTQYDFSHHAKSISRYPYQKWNHNENCWEYVSNDPRIIKNIVKLLNDENVRGKYLISVSDKCNSYLKQYMNDLDGLKKSITVINKIKNGDSELEKELPIKKEITPFAHQVTGYNIGLSTKSSAMLMEMGCGKTLTEVAIAGKRFLNGEITKCLIAAPVTVLGVWKDEFEGMSTVPTKINIVRGTPKQKREAMDISNLEDGVLNILIISYDAISPRKKKVIIDGKDSYTFTGGSYDELISWIGDDGDKTLMVLDESQRIKNRASNRAMSIHNIGDKCRYKNILSGTPITQSPLDVFSQYRFLNPDVFGIDFYSFRGKYAIMGGFKNKEIVGYKNLDELQEKAHSIGYRVSKEDALDLPETTDMYVYCTLNKSKKIYNKIMDGCIKELMDTDDKSNNKSFIAITKLLRLSQITGGFLPDAYELSDDGSVVEIDHKKNKTSKPIKIGDEKLNTLKGIIEDYPINKKLVIFCKFIPEINAIKEIAKELKRTVETITGETKNRDGIINNFQNNENPNIIIIQIQTGGLGITLTRADTVIFYSYDYSFANYEQAKARIHRIGQKNNCTYIHLVTENTIDQSIIGALKSKKSVADYIVDMKDNFDDKIRDFLFGNDNDVIEDNDYPYNDYNENNLCGVDLDE